MKRTDKIFLVVLGTLLFVVSGGIACTYASGINLVLVAIFGVLAFIGVGYTACTYSMRKQAKGAP